MIEMDLLMDLTDWKKKDPVLATEGQIVLYLWSDQKKNCEFAVCTAHSFSHLPRLYWKCTLCLCAWLCARMCVLHKDTWLRPLLFFPPTSHTQSANPSCCLILKKPTTHSHTYTHSSEANMTKVDSRKLHDGSLKSSRGSWWNALQLPVIQPCRTEWPKWPPGVTATVTKLNVLLSILQFSVVSLARSLALFLFFLYSLHMNSTMKSLHNSTWRRWYHFYGAILFKG